jgi:3-deoxy-D-manno-octulosonic-acid transferase
MIEKIENGFIRVLYLGVRALAGLALVLYFLYRGLRDRRYFGSFGERLGGQPASYKPTGPGGIWLHAVSVGEVISAIRLIEELRARNPAIPVFVSITTLAGRALADEKLHGLADAVFYAPIDYAFAVRRSLKRLRPAVVAILETEIWPALYGEVKRAGCGLLIVNGRISDRAFTRYRRLRFFFRSALRAPDAILTQSDRDRARYIELGAPQDRVETLGNLKYDAKPARTGMPEIVRDLLTAFTPDRIWIAASTMPGADSEDVDEEEVVIGAFRQLAAQWPRLLLILAPRKPERFQESAERLAATGIPCARRSENRIASGFSLPGILLLDSIGELASLFPLAEVVFMGGTLARRGGHNILEPAACAKPVVVGPHMENFAAIADEFRAHRAMVEIAAPGELGGAVGTLLSDPELCRELGARAAALSERRQGAAGKAAERLLALQDLAIPEWNRPGLVKPLLWPLSRVWIAVSRWKQRRDRAHASSLATPVVSIGGIAMGGTGKTPLVGRLAEGLWERGYQAAVLTRGYRRRSIEKSVVIAAGSAAPAHVTGDEPQILVREGSAHVGIGPDRCSTGKILEARLRPDVFLLDDGFQHARLRRDLDIVAIDALNPFAGAEVFPLGGLREPLDALGRASAFVITRAQPGRAYRGIRGRLAAFNPGAPVFLAGVEPRGWIDHRTGKPAGDPAGPAVAFCGLGNPAAFWETLRARGIEPVFRWSFEDHHHYMVYELRMLAAQAKDLGAKVLLTTEKDVMNFPEDVMAMLPSVELYWLKIEMRIENEEGLLALIEQKIGG